MPKKFLVLLFLLSLIAAAIFLFKTKQREVTLMQMQPLSNTSATTSFPFVEMTIPYLRSRAFLSKIGAMTKYQQNSSYTSYLTSYDSDGLKINGLLTVPQQEMPEGGWPAIVFVHGYVPPSLYKTTERYVNYVDYLAKKGFVVFKIDLRGHGSSEGEPTGAYYSTGYVIDTLNAYSALQNSSFVNAKRVGVWGHSMAGNITFRSFVVKKDIPALVIWAGAGYSYQDLAKYRLNDQSYRPPEDRSRQNEERRKMIEMYGDFSDKSDFWKKVVPTNYLEGVTGAVEIHHAEDDTVVNINYSRDLMKILDTTQIAHSLSEYKTGGHNISGVSFNKAMEETVKFFKEQL